MRVFAQAVLRQTKVRYGQASMVPASAIVCQDPAQANSTVAQQFRGRCVSLPTIGGSRDRGVWHTNFGINYGSISFGQLSGYIVFCILLIGGASPPI